jgi:hypothetical protein
MHFTSGMMDEDGILSFLNKRTTGNVTGNTDLGTETERSRNKLRLGKDEEESYKKD